MHLSGALRPAPQKGEAGVVQVRWSVVAALAAVATTVAVPASASASPGTATATVVTGLAVGAPHLRAGNQAVLATRTGRAAVARAIAAAPELATAATFSARQYAGQRVIYGYSGLTPPASLLSLIRHGDAAGVIFFAGNYASRSQFSAAVKKLIAANASTSNPARAYPLLLMTDQEGGEVKRLPGAPDASEKQIGEISPLSAAEAAARKAGRGAASTLHGFGLNVNLAPVLDVYRKAGNFDDQYQRSYSSSQYVVSDLGASFISAQQNHGVAATAKHFPGLGAASASQNTDERPVTLNVSPGTLWSKDEYPYRAAIAAKVDLVMVSWAVYPKLGSNRPAGLSSVMVQGQLRGRLGYTGVTITDAIGAGALSHYGSTGHRAELAALAGMDIIMASDSVSQGVQVMDGLEAAYQDGALPQANFQAAVRQILALRKRLPT
jgi:beta-N-acetylhexosaminidase